MLPTRTQGRRTLTLGLPQLIWTCALQCDARLIVSDVPVEVPKCRSALPLRPTGLLKKTANGGCVSVCCWNADVGAASHRVDLLEVPRAAECAPAVEN